jgi:hypothetical protein
VLPLFFLPQYGPSCGTKKGGTSTASRTRAPIPLTPASCYKPSISDHPSGLHEQRTRLISATPHETYYTRPAEATAQSTLRYPCFPASEPASPHEHHLCLLSHHTSSALKCISLTGGRGLSSRDRKEKVARAACVLLAYILHVCQSSGALSVRHYFWITLGM